MRELAERALNVAQVRGATYADVRIEERRIESLSVKNGAVETLITEEEQGFGVRAIADGAWGFASGSVVTGQEIDRIAAMAASIARASAIAKREDVRLGQPIVSRGSYRTPFEIDPFSISLEDKIALLMAADAAMRKAAPIAVAEGSLEWSRVRKTFASTEGSFVEQELIRPAEESLRSPLAMATSNSGPGRTASAATRAPAAGRSLRPWTSSATRRAWRKRRSLCSPRHAVPRRR